MAFEYFDFFAVNVVGGEIKRAECGGSALLGARGAKCSGEVTLWDGEDLYFVAIGVGDECHLAVRWVSEFFAPVAWPDFDAVVFEFVAIGDDVFDADAGVHEVFWEFDFEFW